MHWYHEAPLKYLVCTAGPGLVPAGHGEKQPVTCARRLPVQSPEVLTL